MSFHSILIRHLGVVPPEEGASLGLAEDDASDEGALDGSLDVDGAEFVGLGAEFVGV